MIPTPASSFWSAFTMAPSTAAPSRHTDQTPGTPPRPARFWMAIPWPKRAKRARPWICLVRSCVADSYQQLSHFLRGSYRQLRLAIRSAEFFSDLFSLTIIAGGAGKSWSRFDLRGPGAPAGHIAWTWSRARRFTFGNADLWRPELHPVLIGLLPCPSSLRRREGLSKDKSECIVRRRWNDHEEFTGTEVHLRGSIFGVILGAIPASAGPRRPLCP